MRTSPRGVALIQEFEGFSAVAYRDPVGIWTIGYGFIEGVREGDRITKDQAGKRLQRELKTYETAVLKAAGECNQNELDALVCFAFNVGTAGMAKSSVIKAHRRGDKQAAARAFALWNKAGGKVWPGLTRRRAAEAALYLEPVHDDVSDPVYGPREGMPQSVEPESSMADSAINKAAGAAGIASAVAGAVSQIKEAAESIGPYLVPLLAVAVVGLCGYIVWQRVQQRRQGWA